MKGFTKAIKRCVLAVDLQGFLLMIPQDAALGDLQGRHVEE